VGGSGGDGLELLASIMLHEVIGEGLKKEAQQKKA
jgi:hypothetical protein